MHIEFLVEELSAEAALNELLPKIFGQLITWHIHVHKGKQDLLRKLPARLAGYSRWLPADWRIIVLVDEDRANCIELKQALEAAASQAGLSTKTKPRTNGDFRIINRIAVEELEAWFFGDIAAIHEAFPRVKSSPLLGSKFRNPDAIAGGTWEALESLLQKHGYYSAGLLKIEAARMIAFHMDPARNRSKSFIHFRDALYHLLPR
jgi:hypothetical protein